MLRSTASKVAWVGRTASMVLGLALVLALIFGVASMALGADGNPFLLGRFNAASALTKLTGDVNGSAMQVVNSNAGADDTALSLNVQTGEAPMKVNSRTRVANLNAALAGRANSAAQADSATNAQNAANADTVDGKNAADLVPGGELPAGTTIRGHYEMDGQGSAGGTIVAGDSISFGYTLPSTPVLRVIQAGQSPPAECPGSAAFPEANAGYLCIYETGKHNTNEGPRVYGVDRTGANIDLTSAAAGLSYSYGTWAVTAPTPGQQLSAATRQNSDVQQNADVK